MTSTTQIPIDEADSTGSGIIGVFDANNFLKQSKLNQTILKDIWELSDPTGKGYLDRNAFYICLKLVALAQSNQPPKLENLNLPTLAPKLGDLSSNITSLISPNDPWYIKASARISYDRTFDSLSPINNKLSGARVKPFLIKSGLSVDILGKIWELSDLDQDGQLDRDEFLIALQLVNKAKEGSTIPDQLPPSLLPFKIRHSSISAVPAGLMTPNAPLLSNSSVFPSIVNEIKPWVVSVEEKTKSDITFNQIDTDLDGYVAGAECKDVFLQTGLSQNILANIWALCDIGLTGKLNCEQFALAMHFVNKKIATGLDPPLELLPEMIPPSLRPKPIVTEEAHASKEFEELQTQVTELQREKLFYEQRASEHDAQTRLKRTELTNLELEMESIYKTLQEREINKSEEQKKQAEFEDKVSKINTQLTDIKHKYESEKSDIEKLKFQIQHIDTAIKTKDNDFIKIKGDLQSYTNDQVNLESRLANRKQNLNELNNSIQTVNFEIAKNKSKIDLLKQYQANLNKLVKEYDKVQVPASGGKAEISDEIKNIEDENSRLNEQIKEANASSMPLNIINTNNFNQNLSNSFNDPFQSPSMNETQSKDAFDPFQSSNSQPQPTQTDPFQAFDPFNNTNDPFKSVPNSNQNDFSVNGGDDPFASAAFDPFKSKTKEPAFTDTIANNEDPFGSKKAPPPRPAPPRPQTPSLKPAKKPTDMSQRPQSALDFTRNNKLDLFNDFGASDPFASNTNPTPIIQNNTKDPFAAFDGWDAFGTKSTSTTAKEKDPFDPFA